MALAGTFVCMAANSGFDLLVHEYLPFRLYSDYKNGMTPKELATYFSLLVHWVEERIEAARLCIEKQIRLEFSSAARETVPELSGSGCHSQYREVETVTAHELNPRALPADTLF